MNSGNTIVLNLGLRSVRATVFDVNLNKIAQSAFLPVRTFMHKNHVEQNPLEWWELSKRAIAEVAHHGAEKITVTSSSSCLVPLDKEGEPVINAVMVSDKRAGKEAAEIASAETMKSIWNNPNLHPVASFMPPKILWMARNNRKAFDGTEKFMGSNDYLVMKLTGAVATDPLNAEKFYYDASEQKYPDEMLDILGIDEKRLPEIRDVSHTVGKITPGSETGIENARVVLSTYDALCSFWGSGIDDYSVAANTCGTVSSMRVASQKGVGKNDAGILSQQFRNFDIYVVGGSNNMEGGLLEWAKNCFYTDHQYRETPYVYDLMNSEASESPVGSNGILFLPYILGERMPVPDPQVRGIFFGMERFHTRKDMVRSVFESIGFMTLDMIRSIEAHGTPVRAIKMSGGLSRNDLVCQIKADFTGRPVHVIDETETTSLGAAFLASGRTSPPMVKTRKVFYPNADMHAIYTKLYEISKDLHSKTADAFAMRSGVLKDGNFILENL